MKDQKNDSTESNVYFSPGDVVQIRQNIPNKPKMIVLKKVASIFRHDMKNFEDKRPSLKGIKCIWFTSDGKLQEYIFNTKDLIKIN